MSLIVMAGTAALIVLLARFGLVKGIDHVAGALGWSVKARGQATGFATSVPELVCLVAAGLSGVWDAGLWNIASSNVINFLLLGAAVVAYRQVREIFHRRFLDEIGFALAAVALPLVLKGAGFDRSWLVIPVLVAFFVLYRVVDSKVNHTASADEGKPGQGSLPLGLILTVTALVLISVVGIFLGDATRDVVRRIGVHPVLAGWILGVVTSLPEMVTFFAVYGAARRGGTLDGLEDTQEALDNLAASNVSNVGLIYPLGLLAYLLVTAMTGS